MVLMKNATGNVYKNIKPNKVDDYLRKSFIVVQDDEGGMSPPSDSALDEVKGDTPSPVQIVEVMGNPLMMDGLYVNQMNREQMMKWLQREGLAYDKRGTKGDFLKIYEKYKKNLKAK